MKYRRFFFGTLVCLSAADAQAQSVWDNGNADGMWNTAANWNPDGVPAGAVAFTTSGLSSASLNGTTNFAAGNLTFGNGGSFAIGNATGDTANLNLSGRTVTVSDAGTYSINLTNGGGTGETATGRVNLNNTTFSVATGGKLVLDGRYTNEGGAVRTITKSGAGTLELAGNFFGNFLSANVTGGTLELNSGGANRRLNGITGISAGATVKVKSANTQLATGSTGFFTTLGINSVAGTLDLNGFNLASGNLSGAATGVITNSGAADATLTLGNYGNRAGMSDRSTTFSGVLSDGPTNKLGLTVNSLTGTSPIFRLTLTGSNTHSGPTAVPAGTLRLLGGNIANSSLALTGAGRLQVGDGTVTYSTASVGGISQDGTSAIELDVASTGHDQLNTTGTYTYTAGSIEVAVADAAAITSGTSFTLVQYGTLAGMPAVNITGLSGSPLVPTVNYGTGSNSAITVTFNLPPAGSLLWTGAADSSWTVGGPVNWNNGGTPTAFSLNDNVTFDDSAPVTRLNPQLAADVQPLSVTFANNAKAYVIAGNGHISGAGTISKTGNGTVTIETNNTHVGANSISAGTLKIGNGGSSGALGTGSIANEGTLQLNRSDTFTVPNVISGGGSLVKTSAGTAMLSGTNSYLGSTTISAGTLQVGDGGATGTLGDTLAIINNGTLAFDRTGTLSVFASITGTGALVKNGLGTVELDADSTYGGGTTISAGTLQLGTGGTTGSVTGAILNDGTLAINRAGDLNFANAVSGIGSVAHRGTGVLRLTGANTYGGNTIIENGGTLLLDTAGSTVPAGTGMVISSGTLDFTDLNLTLFSLTKAPSGTASVYAAPGKKLTVQDGDMLVNQGTLNLNVDSFAFNSPSGTFNAVTTVNGGSAALLAAIHENTFTAASFLIANGGPGGSGISSGASVQLGESNKIHADTITIGANSAQSGTAVLQLSGTAPSLEIRGAAGGTSRANMTVGYKSGSDYAGGTASVDLTAAGSTLDALVGDLVIGRHEGGTGNFNNATTSSFLFNTGTLDATSIRLGVAGAPAVKTSSGSLVTHGGTIKTGTLTLVEDSGGAIGSASVDLDGTSILEATTITGQAAANATIHLRNGATLRNTPAADLAITGTTLHVPADATGAWALSAGQVATLDGGTTFNVHFDSSTLACGKVNLTGSAVLGAAAVLTIADDQAAPVALASGQKLVLINYSAGSLSGTFAGLADGATITVGAQSFVIDYNDPAYAGKAVTLTVPSAGSTYTTWATANAGGQGADSDFDKDGVPNAVEYLMGQTGSTFTPNPKPVNGKITWPKNANAQATWAVQTSSNLAAEGQPGGWANAAAGVVDLGTSIEFTLPTGNPKLFARLKVTVP
jgi:autotransporter-associated beta strand protein